MASNFVLREFHNSDDCVIGNCLKVIGRKFKPVPNQNFVKINGPGDCWVHKKCEDSLCNSIRCSDLSNNFKRFGFNEGDGFRKKDIIIEPFEGYDGPDFKGTKKHGAKAYNHTPSQAYNVKSTQNSLFAIGYIDVTRQKRSGDIELVSFKINKDYSKI